MQSEADPTALNLNLHTNTYTCTQIHTNTRNIIVMLGTSLKQTCVAVGWQVLDGESGSRQELTQAAKAACLAKVADLGAEASLRCLALAMRSMPQGSSKVRPPPWNLSQFEHPMKASTVDGTGSSKSTWAKAFSSTIGRSLLGDETIPHGRLLS